MGFMNRPGNMGGDWETVGGGAWHAGQRVDPGGWTYSTNYSGKIPEGARTFNPNTPPGQRDPRTGAPLHMNPLWTQGGSEYYWLNEDGTPAGSTGFTGSNVSNAPWNATPQVRGGGSQIGQQGGGGGQPGGMGQYGGGGGGQQFGLGGGGQQGQGNWGSPYSTANSGWGGPSGGQPQSPWGGGTPQLGGQGPSSYIAGLMNSMYGRGTGQGGDSQGYGGWGGLQTNQAWR